MRSKTQRQYDIGCVPSTFWFGFVGSNILVPMISLLAGIKVKPDKRFLKAEGPIIVVSNHESFLDPMVTSRLTHGRKVNFVCGEFLFRKHFWGHVFKLGGAIPKKQFAADTVAVKAMMKVMKRAGVLIIYPEATRHVDGHSITTFDDGVAKLAKKCGASVFVQRIHGAYLTMPRWCPKIKVRRGRITSEFVKIIDKSEVDSMSVSDLDRLIKDSIDYDENKWARDNHMQYKGGDLASGLWNIAYRCRKCSQDFTLKQIKGDTLQCSGCGAEYRYMPDGSIICGDEVTDLHEWTNWEKSELARELDDLCIVTECELHKEKDQFEFVVEDKGTLTVRKGVITFEGREKVSFEMKSLRGIVCKYGRHFEVYDGKGELFRFVIPGELVYKIEQTVELCGRFSHE